MDNKKRILLVILALVLVMGTIGVYLYLNRGGGNGNGSGDKIELVYWGLWEPEEHLQEVIEDFESEHPNIDILYSYERFTNYEDRIYEQLDDPKITPDIVRINNTWTYKFEDLLAPVPPEIMTVSEYQSTFYSAALDDFTGSDDYLYAIPWEIDGLGLYYNKDLFEKAGITSPPQDWDTLVEYAKELTETDGTGTITQAGAALGCENNINHSADILAALMLQNGVQMTSSDGRQALFTPASRSEGSLTYYTEFASVHGIWSCGLRNDLEMFAGGKLAMMFAPSWRVFDIINMNSSINFDTAPLPQLVGNQSPIHYGMYWGDAVSAQSSHKFEAWQFVKFLSEKEQQQKMYAAASQNRAFGEPYSLPDLASEIEDAPYVGPYIQMAQYYESWRMGDQRTCEAALNKAINDVTEGNASVHNAIGELTSTIGDHLTDLYGM